MESEITVFIDTNIFLHFKELHELNLPKLLNCKKVIIVIQKIVFSEIDKHKDSHPKAKIKKRAKKVLKNFQDWMKPEGHSINDEIIIQFDRSFKFKYDEYDLDSSKPDDVLIAAMLHYIEKNPSIRTVLITDDGGPIIHSKLLGLNHLQLPYEYKLPEDLDPIEKENNALKREIEIYKNARPKLSLKFNNDKNTLKVSLPQIEEVCYEQIIAKKREELEKNRKSKLHFQYRNFEEDISTYLNKYRTWLENNYKMDLYDSYNYPVNLKLLNSGNIPAEDVELTLTFPEFVTLSNKLSYDQRPPEPQSPFRPLIEKMDSMLYSFDQPSYKKVLENIPSINLNIKENEAIFNLGKVKHKVPENIERVFMLLLFQLDISTKFQISYFISSSNIPEPIEGSLNVIVSDF